MGDDGIQITLFECSRCGRKRSVWIHATNADWPELLSLSIETDNREVCDECKLEMERGMQAVKEGGLTFLCECCGASGVIPRTLETSHIIDKLRKVAHNGKRNWRTARTEITFSKCSEHGAIDTDCSEKET